MKFKKHLSVLLAVTALSGFSAQMISSFNPNTVHAASQSSKSLVTKVSLKYDKAIQLNLATFSDAYDYTIKVPKNNDNLSSLSPKYPNSFKGLSQAAAGLVKNLNKTMDKYVKGDKSTKPKEDFVGRSQAVVGLSNAVDGAHRGALPLIKNKINQKDYKKLQLIHSKIIKDFSNKKIEKEVYAADKPSKKRYAIITRDWELSKSYLTELSKVFAKLK